MSKKSSTFALGNIPNTIMANTIVVKDTPVTVVKVNNEDYISLTDMMRAKDGDFFFHNWLRNRNTVEFLGIWEKVYNPNFNPVEFDIIKSKAGLNNFRLSAKEWMEKTGAIGIISRTARCIVLSDFPSLSASEVYENGSSHLQSAENTFLAVQPNTFCAFF